LAASWALWLDLPLLLEGTGKRGREATGGGKENLKRREGEKGRKY